MFGGKLAKNINKDETELEKATNEERQASAQSALNKSIALAVSTGTTPGMKLVVLVLMVLKNGTK